MTQTPFFRRVLSLLAIVGLLVAAPACDSGSNDGDDGGNNGNNGGVSVGDITGMWRISSGPDVLYLYITEDTITFIDYLGDSVDQGEECYEHDSLDIISSDDGVLQLGDADSPAFTVPFTFSRSGDNLVIGYAGFGLTLSPSNETPASLTPQCDFSGKTGRPSKFDV